MLLDSIIVGGGPAGLAVACEFQKNGVAYKLFDKGAVANHILQFPVFMNFFSSKEFLEIDNFPLTIPEEKPDRRQYLNYLNLLVKHRNLNVETFSEVLDLQMETDGKFKTEVKRLDDSHKTFYSKTAVIACGAYESPRLINIEGENLPHVSHHFTETHKYFNRKVLIVGGRNSAIETALILHRSGAEVSLAFRKEDFSESSIKYWLRPDIEARLLKKEIIGYPGCTPVEIQNDFVVLKNKKNDLIHVKTDFVLLMTGYEPPLNFMKKIGMPFPENSPVPVHNPETLETSVSGMFIAGVVTAGNISGKVFIENSREHGTMIMKRLRDYL